MLCVMSPYEMALSKAEQRRVWEAFSKNGSSHSGRASTLPYIMRRCELEKIPYSLQAMPGRGYVIRKLEEV